MGSSLCGCPEVVEKSIPSYRVKLQANNDGKNLKALEKTIARRRKKIPKHEPWCSNGNNKLEDMLEATSVAEGLMRSLEEAYSEAASNNGNSAGPAIVE